MQNDMNYSPISAPPVSLSLLSFSLSARGGKLLKICMPADYVSIEDYANVPPPTTIECK